MSKNKLNVSNDVLLGHECQMCGEWLGNGNGYPQTCTLGCDDDY